MNIYQQASVDIVDKLTGGVETFVDSFCARLTNPTDVAISGGLPIVEVVTARG